MHIIVKVSVKSSKHDQTVADKNTRMATSWFRKWCTYRQFFPSISVRIKALQITDVLIISTTNDVNFIIVLCCCMSPSCTWKVRCILDLDTSNKSSFYSVFCKLDKLTQIKYVHFIKMDVLTMTTTKCYDSVLTNSCCSVKSLCLETLYSPDIRLMPKALFKI